jgi:hypothetical protein
VRNKIVFGNATFLTVDQGLLPASFLPYSYAINYELNTT